MVKAQVNRGKRSSGLHLRIHRRELANGLILLAVRNRTAPTLAISCSLMVGRMEEAPEQAGISYLVGESLDEGTSKWTGDELASLVEGYGGSLVTTGSGAAIRMAAEDAGLAVKILSEVILRPTLPKDGVRRMRELALAEIQSERDEPRTVASISFQRLVYGEHPYGRPSKGSLETMAAITPAQCRNFHRKWYVPSRAIIAGSGDLDPQELLDLLEKAFGSWKDKKPKGPKVEEPRELDGILKENLIYPSNQVQVFLGHLGIKRTDPDFYKLLVMDHVLGSGPGFTSRISRKLRDEQGLAYTVGASITHSAGTERGMFSAYIGTSPGQEERAIQGFLREIKAIRKQAPSRKEMEDVKAYLTGSFVWALERNSNLARFLIRMERFQLGADYIERYPEIIRKVSAQDVREVAQKHLHPDRYVLLRLGP
ncbi:MAG TPA: insulinase family protein [Planctomycetes bacterium]|nr:insulinase family protein [Planctomycetota bacterium]